MKVGRIILLMLVAMFQDSEAYRNNEAALDLTADVLRNSRRFGHTDLRRHIHREGGGAVHHNRHGLTQLHRSGRRALSGHSRKPEGWHSKKSALKHKKRHFKSRKSPNSCVDRISRLMKDLSQPSKYETKLTETMDNELSHPFVDHYNEFNGSPFNEVFDGTAKIDAIACDTKKYRNSNNPRFDDEDALLSSCGNMGDRHFHAYKNLINKRFALHETANQNKAAMDTNAPYIYNTWERIPEGRFHPEETDKLKKEEVAMKYWRDHMANPGKVSFVGKFGSQAQQKHQPAHEDQQIQNYHCWPRYDSKYYRQQ